MRLSYIGVFALVVMLTVFHSYDFECQNTFGKPLSCLSVSPLVFFLVVLDIY